MPSHCAVFGQLWGVWGLLFRWHDREERVCGLGLRPSARCLFGVPCGAGWSHGRKRGWVILSCGPGRELIVMARRNVLVCPFLGSLESTQHFSLRLSRLAKGPESASSTAPPSLSTHTVQVPSQQAKTHMCNFQLQTKPTSASQTVNMPFNFQRIFVEFIQGRFSLPPFLHDKHSGCSTVSRS